MREHLRCASRTVQSDFESEEHKRSKLWADFKINHTPFRVLKIKMLLVSSIYTLFVRKKSLKSRDRLDLLKVVL